MTARRKFLQTASFLGLGWIFPEKMMPGKGAGVPVLSDSRVFWYELLSKIALPILDPMSRGQLKASMQIEYSPAWGARDKTVAYMEAFGRLIAGLSPWLALPQDETSEGKLRTKITELLLKAHTHAVNPNSPDYLTWHREGQPLVDAAFIAHSFLRAPKQTWEMLDGNTRKQYIEHFKSLRRVKPPYNNWLLFAAMVEAFLFSVGEAYDSFRVDIALRKHEEWYAGDGWFKDGPVFHFDYYNGYVIHPMLLDILKVFQVQGKQLEDKYRLELKRMQRYSTFLERLISPEGTFPAFGRSITYRLGAFQPLSQLALMDQLPDGVSNGQVRAALSAVANRMFGVEGNFTDKGYLRLGFAGHQPTIADYYSNSGSMYLTSLGFLHLGLPADHAFWTSPAEDWTSRKAWSGQPFNKDYAVDY